MGNMTTLQILQGVHDWVLDKIDEETANFITKTVNDLVNYYTKSETYTKAEVQQIVDAIKQFTYEVVQVLPTASASTMNKIYLVPAPKSEDKNVKEEYITIQDGSTYSWEMLGTTSIDLSNYYTKGQTDSAISSALSSALASYTTTADLTTLLSQKQDVIQDLADIRSGASAGSTAVQPSTLNNAVKNVVAESGVYDVSANNDNTKFESLSALLSSANLNTLIPTDIRKGGMSIKFVLSSDNIYVQYRLTKNDFSTYVADWMYDEKIASLAHKDDYEKFNSFSASGHPVTTISGVALDDHGVITSDSSNDKAAYVVANAFKKGEILNFVGVATGNRGIKVCYSQTDLSGLTKTQLVGTQLIGEKDAGFNAIYTGLDHNWDVVIPEDNLYVVIFINTSKWTSRNWNIYINNIDEKVAALDTAIVDLDSNKVGYISENKTELEKNIARRNIDGSSIEGNILADNSLTYFDFQLFDYTVNSEGSVASSRYSRLGCKRVSKGDVLTIYGHSSTGTSKSSNIVLWYSTERPTTESTGLVKQFQKSIDGGVTDAIMEWTAPADGWLVVRYFGRSTNYYILFRKEPYNYIDKGLYAPEKLDFEITTNKAIVADPDSESFGQVVSTNSNTYGVTDFINIDGVKYILLRVVYSISGYMALNTYGGVFYDNNKSPIATAYVTNYSDVAFNGFAYIAVPDNAKYIRLTVSATNPVYFLRSGFEDTFVKKEDYTELVAQAKFVANSPTTQSLGLLHFSDIHGDQTAADEIVKQISKLSPYITDVLCTGDSVHYYADGTSSYPQGSTWWKETSGLADKALFVLGNHDGATSAATEYDQKEDSAAWDGKGKDWCFETYIEPYITELGYVMPTGYDDSTSPNYHACFWHKDYAAQKIRVIGLDCMHRFDGVVNPTTGEITTAGLKYTTNEQELWLIARLNETLINSGNAAAGYSVVIVCHYPIDDFSGNNEAWDDTTHKFIYNQKETGGRVMSYKTGGAVNFHYELTTAYDAAVKFNMRNRVDNGYSESQPYPNYTKGSTNNVGEILKAWKNNGGKFVVWLCGHTHADFMWYSTNYPDMLCMVLDQAGNLRGTSSGSRPATLDSRTCANYIAIDTQNGLLKVVRIGYQMNKLMNSHRYMCYDYINKKVLNEG